MRQCGARKTKAGFHRATESRQATPTDSSRSAKPGPIRLFHHVFRLNKRSPGFNQTRGFKLAGELIALMAVS
jgi:hypothetical protein